VTFFPLADAGVSSESHAALRSELLKAWQEAKDTQEALAEALTRADEADAAANSFVERLTQTEDELHAARQEAADAAQTIASLEDELAAVKAKARGHLGWGVRVLCRGLISHLWHVVCARERRRQVRGPGKRNG
jgi:DNA repair exonuclease SbcCD ATPase subunit